jgi:hypothetical protein
MLLLLPLHCLIIRALFHASAVPFLAALPTNRTKFITVTSIDPAANLFAGLLIAQHLPSRTKVAVLLFVVSEIRGAIRSN